jgi:hypothetical protein
MTAAMTSSGPGATRRSRGDARPEVRPAADPPTVLDNLRAHVAGEPLAGVVDRVAGY